MNPETASVMVDVLKLPLTLSLLAVEEQVPVKAPAIQERVPIVNVEAKLN